MEKIYSNGKKGIFAIFEKIEEEPGKIIWIDSKLKKRYVINEATEALIDYMAKNYKLEEIEK